MGEVYRAQDPRLGRHVAIKVLPERVARDPDAHSRFEREAKAVAALSHPNILSIYDVGSEGDLSYAVMELLEGETLRTSLQRGVIAWSKALDWAVAIAEGLAAAHAKGIIHRDLKPENIFVTTDGRIKILDFGLVRYDQHHLSPDVSSAATQNKTEPGTVLGTVSYMSPEQVRGEAVESASDVFSFGCVLCEMVTGKRAFSRETSAETMVAILKEEPPEFGSGLPLELQGIIRHCLEKKPTQRFRSASDLAFALKTLLGSQAIRSHPETPVDAGHQTSIAVLPFADMSPEKDQEYFCDGMAEELINALTKVPGLRVASRTSAFQFRGKAENIQRIGEQLKAETVLEGSVRKAGTRLRITAQLIKVADGYHLWSEKYDRDTQDVFAVQDEIAQAIVDKLKVGLLGEQAPLIRRYTSNQEAYSLYLKGRYFWNKRYEVGVQKGIQLFQQAIEKDPSYALAYAGLADCYSLLGHYGFVAPRDAFPKARSAAEKALEIDPTLSESRTSIAMIQLMEMNFPAGESSLLKAISLNPKTGVAYALYGMLLSVIGRNEEAIEMGRLAQELDPLNPNINGWTGGGFYFQRCYDQALEQYEKALEVDPHSMLALTGLGLVYAQKLMFADAIEALLKAVEVSKREAYALGLLGMIYGRSGNIPEAEAILDELAERSKHTYVMPLASALVYIGLGEKDHAFEWLEKAGQDQNSLLWMIPAASYYDSLRSDPRFAALLQKMGLDRYAQAPH
jgi:serine/threonine protein kinase/Tfp pilus assembly protein PilF